jgi:L-seryl-tRNA(Ser) seleniumtransferase
MGIYEELGIRRVINAQATLTALGGSIMPQEVVEAMCEASRSFIDIWELQKRVGQKLASLTHNEAAYVSCGAAAALTLATAACVAGSDADKRAKLPRVDETMKSEVIVHKHGRVGYDYAVRMVGVTLVEIGDEEGTACDELKEAINEKTAAIFYFANPTREWRLIPYEEAIGIAKRHGVPVVIDAAAQLFSGGKGLCGPQASGLTVGRQDLIDAMAFNGPPHAFIGRGMKVGKEELVGLLAAVKWYVGLDHKKLMKEYEDQVGFFREQLAAFDGVRVGRNFPSEAGQPMPRTEIIFDDAITGIARDEIVASLRDGEPSIRISGAGPGGVYINPQTLCPGEEEIIARRIKEVLGGSV